MGKNKARESHAPRRQDRRGWEGRPHRGGAETQRRAGNEPHRHGRKEHSRNRAHAKGLRWNQGSRVGEQQRKRQKRICSYWSRASWSVHSKVCKPHRWCLRGQSMCSLLGCKIKKLKTIGHYLIPALIWPILGPRGEKASLGSLAVAEGLTYVRHAALRSSWGASGNPCAGRVSRLPLPAGDPSSPSIS